MKTPENDNYLQQELRLAQLEIKLLREQLLKATEAEQRARAEAEKSPEQPAKSAAVSNNHDKSPNDFASNDAKAVHPRVLYVEDSAANLCHMRPVLS